ncbi:hypothetical protein HELRODRAFT_79878, partial [Helobdella robusta]
LLVDSRSFLEYSTNHIQSSMNVASSKMIKRRLLNDEVALSVRDLLRQSSNNYSNFNTLIGIDDNNNKNADDVLDIQIDPINDVIIYDQCSTCPDLLNNNCFLHVLITKSLSAFKNVFFLRGGFIEFQSLYPSLCYGEKDLSISQPCISVSVSGPTRVLPFLFLGSQQDAMSQEIMTQNGISYVLNVSLDGDRPPFLGEGHFLRIPIRDSHYESLLPHLPAAFQFIDKVRETNECVLVHCLAGISRSPSLAIAYLMNHLGLSVDGAYK